MNAHPVNPLRALVFDFGGVIFVNPGDPRMTKPEHDEIWDAMASITDTFHAEMQSGSFTVEDFKIALLERTPNVSQDMRDLATRSVGLPDPEVLALIDHYHPRIGIYGLVNASYGWTEIRRGIHRLDKHFTRILASHEVNVRKPDPKIFQHFLQATGLQASTCMFIDDQEPNVTAAKELGFQIHLFRSANELRKFLKTQLR